jgi:DNA-binding NarL/FixJ family response regulator
MVVEMIKEIVAHTEELEWAGYATSMSTAIKHLQSNDRPGLLMLDISLPDGNALDMWHEEALKNSRYSILVITGRSDQRLLEFITSHNVMGALDKLTARLPEWRSAMHTVAAGQRYFSPSFEAEIENFKNHKPDWVTRLSRRELELLHDFGHGRSDSKIAHKYQLTPSTIQTHRRNIMSKLEIHSSSDLVRWCVKNGFVRFLNQ